ncbi:RNA ligase 1-like isoform X3 [Manis javanica]
MRTPNPRVHFSLEACACWELKSPERRGRPPRRAVLRAALVPGRSGKALEAGGAGLRRVSARDLSAVDDDCDSQGAARRTALPEVFLSHLLGYNSQPFKVLATETVSQKALDADIHSAIPTEKVDGTCCYVITYRGQPYLWAWLDRKPNKQAEKRFKNFLCSKQNSKEFFWNIEEDFKPVPECWIPAKEIEQLNGNPMPDENGHIPGWVPVEKTSKQYCWHSSVVNCEFEIALVLKHHPDEPGLLEMTAVPLSDLLEQTLELIGTNVNGNSCG